MAKKRRTWRWVTRDGITPAWVTIWCGAKKPTYEDSMCDCWQGSGDDSEICSSEFRRLFGFLPPIDRPVKVEFTARILDDKE